MGPTPTQLPPHPSGNMLSPVLIFGIPVLMGLVLVLASVWGFVTWKMRRRRRKREKPNEESKGKCLLSLPCLIDVFPHTDSGSGEDLQDHL